MSYQTFYRKYRPSDLDDVGGQHAIVKIVKNSLILNRIAHAYLFCGPRGTGKTTMARILAKNINCLDIKEGISCGKCRNCLSIMNGNCPDIIEMDAASNNGVDEIREIKNKISLVPTELKYKVYVIDEVHMLSSGAFNALLKTLEEPPEHVIFILATTDIHKVPITIISRCQCFDFHRIREKEIVDRLQYIVNSENIHIESDILGYIANLSDGGFRDAIGMLDKLVSYSGGNEITISDFEDLNGIVSTEEKKCFLKIVEEGKVKDVIQFIDNIYNGGKDLIIFSQNLMVLCRNLIIEYYSYQKIEIDIEFLLSFVEAMNELVILLKNSNNIKIIFETRIISFIYRMNHDREKSKLKDSIKTNNYQPLISDFNENNSKVDITQLDKVKSEDTINNISQKKIFKKRNSLIVNNCLCSATKENLNDIKNRWNTLNDYALDNQYGAVACYLSDATVRAASAHEIIITFDYESLITRGFMLNEKVEQLLNKITGDNYYVAYLTVGEWNDERKKYIENKNSGNHYTYQNLNDVLKTEQEKVDSNQKTSTASSESSIVNTAIDLFGENIVSISE